MRKVLRQFLILVTLGVVATAVVATTATAKANGNSGQQLDVLAKKIAHLEAKGETAKTGALTALADCGYGDASQVFLPFGDAALYALAPQGDLSSTSEWSLTDVGVSAATDPFTTEAGSLTFSAGDSEAVTPVMCVNLDNPTMRFFLSHHGGNGTSQLEVSVLYEAVNGKTRSLTLADLSGGSDWQPSPVIPIGVDTLSAVSASGWTPVAFDFSVNGLQPGESYSLDGIYVDPCWSR